MDRDDVIAKSQMHDRGRCIVCNGSTDGYRDDQQRGRERNEAQMAHGDVPPIRGWQPFDA
jgi:hypothetical protein